MIFSGIVIRRLAVTVMFAMFAACTPLQQTAGPDTLARDNQIAALQSLSVWQADGRIAVRHSGGGGQGRIQWQQNGPDTDIVLSGPLGIGATQIIWRSDTVSLITANGEEQRRYEGLDAAEQFLASELGWQLPVSSIRYWLLGVPDPVWPHADSFDESGQLQSMQQRGWVMTYKSFALAAGRPVPTRMDAELGSLRLRVIVDDWEL